MAPAASFSSSKVEISGIGLHSGHQTTVKIYAAPTGSGRVFVRTDLADSPVIPASIESVHTTTLSTELRSPMVQAELSGTASIRTVEHLLASLMALGVQDARIEIDGLEVPLLDGSAKLWVEAIQNAGMVGEMAIGEPVTEAIWIHQT
jgi:UDP-3-O-[3-hydroxymyristoyl] N-acetylglucosamine deacetylase